MTLYDPNRHFLVAFSILSLKSRAGYWQPQYIMTSRDLGKGGAEVIAADIFLSRRFTFLVLVSSSTQV